MGKDSIKKVPAAFALFLVLTLLFSPMAAAVHSTGGQDIIQPDTLLENKDNIITVQFLNNGPDNVENIIIRVPSGFSNFSENSTPAGWQWQGYDGENIRYSSPSASVGTGQWSPPFKFYARPPALPAPSRQDYTWVVTTIDNVFSTFTRSENTAVVSAKILQGVTDSVLNTDNLQDNLQDYLRLTVPIEAKKSDNYKVRADLYDNENVDNRRKITSFDSTVWINVGTNTTFVDFDGRYINDFGENGPYFAEISVDNNSNMFVDRFDYFINYPYYYENFEVLPVKIFSMSASPYNGDSDPENENLILTVETKVKVSGSYKVHAELWSDSWNNPNRFNIDIRENTRNLSSADNIVTISFDGRRIYSNKGSGPYFIDVRIEDNFNTLINTDNSWTQPYQWSSFQNPPVEISTTGSQPHTTENRDTDNDGKLDYLVVKAKIEVYSPGQYNVHGDLFNASRSYKIAEAWADNYYSTTGTYQVELKFTGYQIYQSWENDQYELQLNVNDPSTQWWDENFNALTILGYKYDMFEPSPAVLIRGDHTDVGIDTDNDGKFDYLRVTAKVQAMTSGTYIINGSLHNNNWQWITWAENIVTLDNGDTYTINLFFSGPAIRNSLENAPYKVNIWLKTQTWETIGTDDYTITTPYKYDNFSPPFASFVSGQHTTENIDSDNDNLYDWLVVNAKLNVRKSGMYHIGANLKDNTGWNFISFAGADNWLENNSADNYTITLKFSGSQIRLKQKNGPYNVTLQLWGEIPSVGGGTTFINGEDTYTTTGNYNYDNFEEPAAYIESSGHGDYAEDTGGAAGNEYLVVVAKIKVKENGTYTVNGSLTTATGDFVGWAENRLYLTTSDNEVRLRFSGQQIQVSCKTPTKVKMDILGAN
ncbi:MAG: hypothetical protein AB1305_00005, partial [Candidatus Hadarchaeota archaeon]